MIQFKWTVDLEKYEFLFTASKNEIIDNWTSYEEINPTLKLSSLSWLWNVLIFTLTTKSKKTLLFENRIKNETIYKMVFVHVSETVCSIFLLSS